MWTHRRGDFGSLRGNPANPHVFDFLNVGG